MTTATGSARTQEMLKALHTWQGIERQSMSDTAEIMEKTQNPLIRIIMEIIRHDSLMHHRVQQFLIDSLTKENVTLSREDVTDIWEQIEAHDRMERKTIAIAKELRDKAWSPIHKQLLDYLITDEQKHDAILMQLDEIKQGMSRASGG
jgi:hypothetical protein